MNPIINGDVVPNVETIATKGIQTRTNTGKAKRKNYREDSTEITDETAKTDEVAKKKLKTETDKKPKTETDPSYEEESKTKDAKGKKSLKKEGVKKVEKADDKASNGKKVAAASTKVSKAAAKSLKRKSGKDEKVEAEKAPDAKKQKLALPGEKVGLPEESKVKETAGEREARELQEAKELSERFERLKNKAYKMDHNLAAHLLGGSFISSAYLENICLEGSQFPNIALFLREALTQDAKKYCTPGFILAMDKLFLDILEIEEKLEEINKKELSLKEKGYEFASWLTPQITSLKPRKNIVLPGGWNGNPGHAMLYEIIRQDDGRFTMRVYNTGKGMTRHPCIILDHKKKYLPYLEQNDLELEAITNPDLWRGYFEISKTEAIGFAFDDVDIYEGLLEVVCSDFGAQFKQQKFPPERYITPQPAGNCVASVLMHFLEPQTDKAGYKSLKVFIKNSILKKYFEHIKKAEIAGPFDKVDLKFIRDKIAVLEFVETCTQKLARSLKKGLLNAFFSTDDIVEVYSLVSNVLLEIEKDKKTYKERFEKLAPPAYTTRDVKLQLDLQLKNDFHQRYLNLLQPNDGVTITGTQILQVERCSQWPVVPAQTIDFIKANLKIIEEAPEAITNEELNYFISRIFYYMPPAHADFWDKLPVAYREECMELISNLSDWFVKTRFGIADSDNLRLEHIYYGQKAYNVMIKLSKSFKELADLQVDVYLKPYYFHMVHDPRLDKEISDTLSHIHSEKPQFEEHESSGFNQFDRNHQIFQQQNVTTYDEEGTVFYEIKPLLPDENAKKKEIRLAYGNKEEAFVRKYLEAYPKVKASIEESIKAELPKLKTKSIADHLIVAVALADNDGKYLPKSFCFLRKQAFLSKYLRSGIFADKEQLKPYRFKRGSKEPFFYLEKWKNSLENYAIHPKKPIQVCQKNQIIQKKGNEHKKFGLFRENFYEAFGDGHNAWKASHNQMICLKAPERSVLMNAHDRKQQVVKAIISYRKKFHELNNGEQQRELLHALFEVGILRKQLKDAPEFSEFLLAFVKDGYDYAISVKNAEAALFFLKLGHYFSIYCSFVANECKDEKQEDKSKKLEESSQRFCTILNRLPEVTMIFSKNTSAINLINQEWIAAAGRVRGKEIRHPHKILKAAFSLSDTAIELRNPTLTTEIRNTFRLYTESLQKGIGSLSEQANLNQTLSQAMGEQLSCDFTHFPMVFNKGKKYRIDLLTGELYKDRTPCTLPRNLLSHPDFIDLYPNPASIKKIYRVGEYANYSFEDELGYENRAIRFRYNENESAWIFLKNINGVWCSDYIKAWIKEKNVEGLDYIMDTCSMWLQDNGQQKLLNFLNRKSKKIDYVYSPHTQNIHKLDSDGKDTGLRLAVEKKIFSENIYQFDPNILIWRDAWSKIQQIEFPRFNLTLVWNEKLQKFVGDGAFKGYFLSDKQAVFNLKRIEWYIILENSEGQKKVVIAKNLIEGNPELSGPLRYNKDTNKNDTYYYYDLDANGELTSKKFSARLYLAYVYLAERKYQKAFELLNEIQPLKLFTENQIDLLRNICNTAEITGDYDVRAMILRLKAYVILLNNKNKYTNIDLAEGGQGRFYKTFEYDLKHYISLASHAGTFGLTREEEVLLFTDWKEAFDFTKDEDELLLKRYRLLTDSQQKVLKDGTNFNNNPASENGHAWAKEEWEEKVNKSILDTEITNSLFRPEQDEIDKHFLSFYSIARHEPPTSARAKKLNTFLKFISFRHQQIESAKIRSLEGMAKLLLAVQKDPDDYHASKMLEKNKKVGKLIAKANVYWREKEKEKPKASVVDFPSTLQDASKKKRVFQPIKIASYSSTLSPLPFSPEKLFASDRKKIETDVKLRAAIDALSALNSLKKSSEDFIKSAKEELSLIRKLRQHTDEYLQVLDFSPNGSQALFTPGEPTFAYEQRDKDQKQQIAELQSRLKSSQAERKSRVEQRGIRELSTDLGEYAKNPTAPMWVHAPMALDIFKKELKQHINSHQIALDKTKDFILELANKRFPGKAEKISGDLDIFAEARKKIEFDDLLILYARADFNEFKQHNPALTTEEVSIIMEEMDDFLLRSVRVQQLGRIKNYVDKILKGFQGNLMGYTETVEELIRELNRKHADFDKRKYPEFLVYEFKKKIMLRDEQVQTLVKMLEQKGDLILQLIMGSGKSDVLLPLLALKNADGEHLSIVMVPEELMKSVSKNMQRILKSSFQQYANRLDWANASFEDLLDQLEGICRRKEFLLVTNKDMHTFILRALETRTNFIEKESKRVSEKMEKEKNSKVKTKKTPITRAISKIKKILKSANVILDEADTLLKCRQETHKAIGGGSEINKEYINVTTLVYDILLTSPDITSKVFFEFYNYKQKTAVPFSSETYSEIKSILAKELAQRLVNNYSELSKKGREVESVVFKYLLSTDKDEESVRKLPLEWGKEIKNILAFARAQCQTFLTSLNKIHNLGYGIFPKKERESWHDLIAGPYRGANKPNWGSQFSHYAEIMNFTIQSYHKQGIPSELLSNELSRITTAVGLELSKNTAVKFHQTKAYKEYIEMVGESTAKEFPLDTVKDDHKKEIASRISKDPRLVNNFLNRYILPKIITFNRRIVSNAQTLVDLFGNKKGFTGTVSEADTFHECFDVDPEKGTDGKTLGLLWAKSRDAVSAVSAEDSLSLLKEILSIDKFQVIIDTGALFKDISHQTLAQEILLQRPECNGVLYFEDDTLMLLKKGAPKPIPAIQTDIPANCFTIYDQQHCVGYHIDQAFDARAAVTINKNQALRDIQQGVWRMRRIDKGQNVHFIIPKEVKKIIHMATGKGEHAKLDVMDLLLFVQKNQAREKAENNLLAIKQKMNNVVFQAVDALLDEVAFTDLITPAFKELNDLLIYTYEDKPYEQYGEVEVQKDAEAALNIHRAQALQKLEEWLGKYKQNPLYLKYKKFAIDMNAIRRQMDKIIRNALLENKERVENTLPINVEASKNLSIELTVNQDAQKEMDKKFDQDQSIDQRQEMEWMNVSRGTPVAYKEWQTGNMFTKKYFVQKVYDLEHLLRQQNFAEKEVIKDLFSKRLLVSVNHAHTAYGETPFSGHRKAVEPILIVQDKAHPETIEFMLLAPLEAVMFREGLVEDIDKGISKDGNLKLYLYYPDLGIVQQGADPIDPKTLEERPEFKLLAIQAKFLSGEIHSYSLKDLEQLRLWLGRHKDPAEVEKFFKAVLLRNPEYRRSYDNSILAAFFKDLCSKQTASMDVEGHAKQAMEVEGHAKQAMEVEGHAKQAMQADTKPRLIVPREEMMATPIAIPTEIAQFVANSKKLELIPEGLGLESGSSSALED